MKSGNLLRALQSIPAWSETHGLNLPDWQGVADGGKFFSVRPLQEPTSSPDAAPNC